MWFEFKIFVPVSFYEDLDSAKAQERHSAVVSGLYQIYGW